jgi:hypothetical protein
LDAQKTKEMTTIQKLIKTFDSLEKGGNDYEKLISVVMREELERSLADEEFMLKTAIMYALDEDGHTGEWKVNFAKRYYDMLKRSNVK